MELFIADDYHRLGVLLLIIFQPYLHMEQPECQMLCCPEKNYTATSTTALKTLSTNGLGMLRGHAPTYL